jgi:hypothetical protein
MRQRSDERQQFVRRRADLERFSAIHRKRQTGWWTREDLNRRPLRPERSPFPNRYSQASSGWSEAVVQ